MHIRTATLRRLGLLFSFVGLAAITDTASAHEIPSDVTVQAWMKPEGLQLHVLVRVPLEAMADLNFPTRGPGYLDLARVEGVLRDAATVWLVNDLEIYESNHRLGDPTIERVRVSLPSDPSFASYSGALEHIIGSQLPLETDLYWRQGLLDVALQYSIESDQSDFSIRPRLERLGLRVLTLVRFVLPDGAIRAYEFLDDPGIVRLDPRWYQAAARFVQFGFFHILDGIDHLLFLVCLVIPIRRMRSLLLVVTSFTLAHSVTLVGSALGLAPRGLWFPALVETLIAMTIVYMAIENIVSKNVERRWMITLAFGLIHGFGFSFALGETFQFAGAHLVASLVSFNIGVELGQLVVLAVCVPAIALLFRYVVEERMGTIILSVIVAHTAWHWMGDRAEVLRQYPWPELSRSLIALAGAWLSLVTLFGAVAWWISRRSRKRSSDLEPEPSPLARVAGSSVGPSIDA